MGHDEETRVTYGRWRTITYCGDCLGPVDSLSDCCPLCGARIPTLDHFCSARLKLTLARAPRWQFWRRWRIVAREWELKE